MDAAKRAFPRAEIIFTGSAKNAQLWAGDKALWTGTDEDQWTGWLRVVDEELAKAGFVHEETPAS